MRPESERRRGVEWEGPRGPVQAWGWEVLSPGDPFFFISQRNKQAYARRASGIADLVLTGLQLRQHSGLPGWGGLHGGGLEACP